jgi:hypothetical protein
MDDLPREFLTETSEPLDTVDVELVQSEREPDNERVPRIVLRLVEKVGRRGDEAFGREVLAKPGSYRSALGTLEGDVLRLEGG